MTNDGRQTWACAGFGEAANHSETPNVEPDFTRAVLTDDGFVTPFVVCRPIAAAAEVMPSYRAMIPLFPVPPSWQG